MLKELSPQFARLCSPTGRPSITPEKSLRVLLLRVLYTIRSERLPMEPLDDHLLCRWCVGLNMDDAVWEPSVFRKHRERLLAVAVAQAFFDLGLARQREWLSDDHVTMDGTLMEAGAGQKRLKRKAAESPSPPPDDPGHLSLAFRGEGRTKAIQASTTAPEARLYKQAKGDEAKLAYLRHGLMENLHVVVIDTRVTQATRTAEREAAMAMAERIPGQQQVTLRADTNSDTRNGVRELRELRATPNVAQKTLGRSSAIAGRTTRHPGDAIR